MLIKSAFWFSGGILLLSLIASIDGQGKPEPDPCAPRPAIYPKRFGWQLNKLPAKFGANYTKLTGMKKLCRLKSRVKGGKLPRRRYRPQNTNDYQNVPPILSRSSFNRPLKENSANYDTPIYNLPAYTPLSSRDHNTINQQQPSQKRSGNILHFVGTPGSTVTFSQATNKNVVKNPSRILSSGYGKRYSHKLDFDIEYPNANPYQEGIGMEGAGRRPVQTDFVIGQSPLPMARFRHWLLRDGYNPDKISKSIYSVR